MSSHKYAANKGSPIQASGLGQAEEAGLRGEQMVSKALEEMANASPWDLAVIRSLRVPKMEVSGKWEIDLVALSPYGLIAFEVKHWGGELSVAGDHWQQVRGRNSKRLADPLALNRTKMHALAQWLRSRGFNLPTHAMHSGVVLSNPQARVNAELEQHPELLRITNLKAWLSEHLAPPPRRFWQIKAPHLWEFDRALAVLDQLPTWDRILLKDGNIIQGDVEMLILCQLNGDYLDRRQVRHLRLSESKDRSAVQAKVNDWEGASTDCTFTRQSTLTFAHAGQNRRETIPLHSVEVLSLGWRELIKAESPAE